MDKLKGTYYIERSLDREIRILAAEKGKGFSEAITEAIELYLTANGKSVSAMVK